MAIRRHLWTIYPPLLVNVVCKRPLSLLKFEPRTHTIFLQLFSFPAFQYSWPFVIHRRCSWTLPWIQCHVLLRVHVFFHSETCFECSHESRWTWCIWRTIWQPLKSTPRVSIFLDWELEFLWKSQSIIIPTFYLEHRFKF